MVRVGSGKFKGRAIKTPATKLTRVSTSYFRKVIFDTLAPFIPEARALDLFAGSGSLGLEAISRSAKSIVFVENHRLPLQSIKENIKNFEIATCAKIIKNDAFAYIEKENEPFDLIFLDPPYKTPFSEVEKLLRNIDTKKLLTKEGAICLEIPSLYKVEAKDLSFTTLSLFKEKTKGETTLLFYEFLSS
ncbi:16S rRNA (guanine(966)-N(2))-methyltransferase RsmD [bacterium]|nr:16S rRNA (guanine(966)-N(2))-methyltransferase RsmD [bacterium]